MRCRWYYRAGYSPDDYPTEVEWDARILVESSSAARRLSIGYHLALELKKSSKFSGGGSVLESLGVDADVIGSAIRRPFANNFV